MIMSHVSDSPNAPEELIPLTTTQEPSRKRKRQSGHKRAPYVTSACDVCHGRKLKCSGDRPCTRCKKQQISCSYPIEPSASRRPAALDDVSQLLPGNLVSKIEELQSQLNVFRTRLSQMKAPATATASSPTLSEPIQADNNVAGNSPNPSNTTKIDPEAGGLDIYAGPTCFTWSMNTAGSRLSNIQSPVRNPSIHGSPVSEGYEREDIINSSTTHPTGHPIDKNEISLEDFTVEDVQQCLETFQSVFGVLHPLSYLEQLKTNTPKLLRAIKRSLWSQPTNLGECGLLEMFKMVIAIAILLQTGGQTALSNALYQSIEPVISAAAFARTLSHEFRVLLLLVGLYHFSGENLVLGARAVMIAARSAVEEGLYRKERLEARIPDQKDRQSVILLLWSLFALDKQINFAAGLPPLLQESDIDIPAPVDAPYLTAMIDYVVLGNQAWESIANQALLTSGKAPSKDSLNFFHYQLHRWQQSLDPLLKFDVECIESDPEFYSPIKDETETYLKTLLYLRSNQIQILVLRPILISIQMARNNPLLITEVVGIARKSIRALQSMATKTLVYKTRQVIFNHFLSSALAVLFLAVAYDAEIQKLPLTPASDTTIMENTEELQIGLDLIDQNRATSESADKLWHRFARPRQHLIRLGFVADKQKSHDTQDLTDLGVNDYSKAVEMTPNFNPQFDLDPTNFDQDDGLLWLDWFEGDFLNSSAPFDLTSWM